MPKLKKTERKKRSGDPEGSPSGGTGVLRASTSERGDGLGGMRPQERKKKWEEATRRRGGG